MRIFAIGVDPRDFLSRSFVLEVMTAMQGQENEQLLDQSVMLINTFRPKMEAPCLTLFFFT